VVHVFLKKYPECQKDSRVSKIRRKFLKDALSKDMSPKDAEEALYSELGTLVRRVSK
jgi:hypothetical protein